MVTGKFLTLKVSGEEINAHYHERGRGRNVVIFAQTGGAATSAYMCWYLNLDAFADAGYHVFAPDSVGSGLSERATVTSERGGISPHKFILAFMDALGIEQAHLIGNSAGAMAIVRLAIENADRVKSLILTGGEPRLETDESRAIAETLGRTERMNFVREMLNEDQVGFDDMKKATADFFCNRDHFTVDQVTRMRLELIGLPGRLEKERLHAQKQTERGRSNYQAADLSTITASVYLIHGRDERYFFTKETAPILLKCAINVSLVVPNCSCTVLAQCGHWPQIEKADTFNALSLQFLNNVAS
jgi:2-hydroxy-6-oxonona-2,4-dienedioate hydrolase